MGLVGEFLPGFAGGLDDHLVDLEDAVGKPVGPQVPPHNLDRLQFRRAQRPEDRDNAGRADELCCRVPPGPVEQENGVGTSGHMAGYLIKMKLYGVGVGIRQGQRRAGSAGRTEGTKEIGALMALVGRLAGSGPASGPLADEAILPADPSLVLELDFKRCFFWQVGQMGAQSPREIF